MTDTHKEEFPPILFPEPKPYGAYDEALSVRQLHFYISGEIVEPEQYTEMIHQIRSAQAHDIIHIHLNTPGGMLSTGVQILNAINVCPGLVVTHLEGEVCSMGSLIFLAGHEMIAYDHCLLMFHNYSGGVFGKGHEQRAALDASEKWFTSVQDKVCYPFLTKAELKKIKDGQDIWMQHDEIVRRLQKVQKAAEKALAEQEAAESVELS